MASASSPVNHARAHIKTLKTGYETLILPDGRKLAYDTFGIALGDTEHLPIFYFHGLPGSRIEGALFDANAQKLGLHIIAPDRPGFGQSGTQANRTLLDWPKDVLALADHLNIDRFTVLGMSGGGPFALAALKSMPASRLKGVSIACSTYSTQAFGTSSMTLKNKVLVWTASWSTTATTWLLDFALGRAARNEAGPDALLQVLRKEMTAADHPECDREAFEEMMRDPGNGPVLIEAMREGIRLSSQDAAWELWLLASDWGFQLSELDASRLTIWHGALDVNAPVGMTDRAVEQLQGVRYKRLEDEGHISLGLHHQKGILLDLMERMTS